MQSVSHVYLGRVHIMKAECVMCLINPASQHLPVKRRVQFIQLEITPSFVSRNIASFLQAV